MFFSISRWFESKKLYLTLNVLENGRWVQGRIGRSNWFIIPKNDKDDFAQLTPSAEKESFDNNPMLNDVRYQIYSNQSWSHKTNLINQVTLFCCGRHCIHRCSSPPPVGRGDWFLPFPPASLRTGGTNYPPAPPDSASLKIHSLPKFLIFVKYKENIWQI